MFRKYFCLSQRILKTKFHSRTLKSFTQIHNLRPLHTSTSPDTNPPFIYHVRYPKIPSPKKLNSLSVLSQLIPPTPDHPHPITVLPGIRTPHPSLSLPDSVSFCGPFHKLPLDRYFPNYPVGRANISGTPHVLPCKGYPRLQT